jgi:hypothetical protein
MLLALNPPKWSHAAGGRQSFGQLGQLVCTFARRRNGSLGLSGTSRSRVTLAERQLGTSSLRGRGGDGVFGGLSREHLPRGVVVDALGHRET